MRLLPKSPPSGAWITAGTVAFRAGIHAPVERVMMERAEDGWALKVRAGDRIYYALLDEHGDIVTEAIEDDA